jgi:ABC-type proline/glycine betaine transport system permease subunit
LSFLHYMAGNWDVLGPEIVTHLQIVVICVAISGCLGILLGIVAARSPRFAAVAIAVTSGILTIPSFALFGAFAIWLGIGNLPVEVGLVLYALLPVLRNTRAGVQAVDPAIVEAARGMGMSSRQVLTRVELPLALPLIVAGLRQATVLVVAIATVGATVGSNNLGQPILAGIRGSNRYAILSGVVPVAAIGVIVDACLGGIQRFLAHGRAVAMAA